MKYVIVSVSQIGTSPLDGRTGTYQNSTLEGVFISDMPLFNFRCIHYRLLNKRDQTAAQLRL